MATMVEKTGRTVEEAINEALEELGITSEEAIIEVLDEG
jgi:predicted RNA-binding protein Jag